MKCPNCNAELAEGTKFCTKCGTKIEGSSFANSNVANDDFDDAQTEIIFDKKLPKERLKGGSKKQTIFTIIAFVIVLAGAGTALLLTNIDKKENLKKGIETSEDGRIVYNKGNKEYANNEIIDDGNNSYYFDTNGEMKKNDWVEVKGKWYYCENDGKIAKSKWIESTYYVNEYGEMLKNTTTPDGYTVDASGKYVDQAAIRAAQEAALAKQRQQQLEQERTNTQQTTIRATTTRRDDAGLNIDYSKPIWIQSYDSFSDYIEFDDETNVDVVIKYPIFGGQDQTEADTMNTCLDELRNDMLVLAENDITEEEKPKKYTITESNIANIEDTKVNVILKGKLERSGKSAKDVRIRFIYDRTSGTAFVKE